MGDRSAVKGEAIAIRKKGCSEMRDHDGKGKTG